MAYPRFHRARAFKLIRRATGSAITLNATAITELAAATNGPGTTGFDIALEAQVGDVLEWGFSGLLDTEVVNTAFDVYTIVSSTRTNPFGVGLSASLGSTAGVSGWYAPGVAGAYRFLTGAALYTVQSGDIASGSVTCRPYYAQATATNKTLYSTANNPLQMWLKNLGPVSV